MRYCAKKRVTTMLHVRDSSGFNVIIAAVFAGNCPLVAPMAAGFSQAETVVVIVLQPCDIMAFFQHIQKIRAGPVNILIFEIHESSPVD